MFKANRDPAPMLRPAGKVFETPSGGIMAELQHQSRPPTPDHVKPFRKSFTASVGNSGRHFGYRNDPLPAEETRFGRRNEYDSSTEACLNPTANSDKLNKLAAEKAEKSYLSSKREPLGKSAATNYSVPDKLLREGFGDASKSSENAKSVIYSCPQKESPLLHEPGAQRSRKYDWAKAKLDPTSFRFGCNTSGNGINTKELFTPPVSTKILPKIVNEHQSVTQPSLSKTKNFGFGDRAQTADFMYGKSVAIDPLNAKMLIAGAGAPLDTDDTLGRPLCKSATLRHYREQDQKKSDPNRVFGVPTVRNDIPRPKHVKVTNGNNYGDDVGTSSLLYPNRYVANGIEEGLFTRPMTLEQLKGISERCNFGLDESAIQKAFKKAAKDGKASVDTFREAVFDLGL